MSAFSFTAPFWTAEQERAELDGLSEEEQRQLQEDLYGPAAADGDEVHTNANDAVRAILGEDTLRADAPPLQAFLRCCDDDPVEAAKRYRCYDEMRRLLFGDDAPVALRQPEDYETLNKGVLQILPQRDRYGRPIVFWDRIRSTASRDSVLRCWFVALDRLSRYSESYVVLLLWKGYDLYMHYDRILEKKWFQILSVMPTLFRAIHACTGSGKSVIGLTTREYQWG